MVADTIAAIATPPGIGGVCIIRISGQQALSIAQMLTGREVFLPRRAYLATFKDKQAEVIDQGIVLYFPAPNSFTGEDVVELQGHGGIAVAHSLLEACFQAGARPAEGGEFTRRAFLNDKLDLAQAEAVADLISARSNAALKAANRSLQGEFSKIVHQLAEDILALRVYIEAALDFPEEEIDFLTEGDVEAKLIDWGGKLDQLLARTTQGQLINEGIDMVLAGKPNAGKSSLLNALAGEDRAIVTEQAGTTRDIVKETLIIEGMPVNVLDTAGLRESTDIVEQEGIRRSREAIAKADIIALLIAIDDQSNSDELFEELTALAKNTPIIRLYNKADLLADSDKSIRKEGIFLSAKTGEGLDDVRKAIAETVGRTHHEQPFIARQRHLTALKTAQQYYLNALKQLQNYHAGELVADDLRLAHDALGEITGKIRSDDLLGEIFSGFCIGK